MPLENNRFSRRISPTQAVVFTRGRAAADDGASLPRSLSHRDTEILNWILAGKSDREIGMILGLSAKTINYHVEKLKDRFTVVTRIQLVAACLHFGCLTWSPEHLMRQPAS
ncbi:MAG: helix-turn-helix domain-containing protein [Hyphomicrobiaceae bacterium]